MVLPEDAGMGLVPASAAKGGFRAHPTGMGPGKHDRAGHDGADPWQVQQLWNLRCSEPAQLGHVGGQVTAEGADPAGEADSFAQACCGRGTFVAGPPASDRSDLGAG